MKNVKFDFAYMFKYSERPKTLAERNYSDDVPEEIKASRLQAIIDMQLEHSHLSNKKMLGKTCKVLIEGISKRSEEKLFGRNSQNSVVIFDRDDLKKGEYIDVLIDDCTSATLFGKVTHKYTKR